MQISEFLQNLCISEINFVKTYIAFQGNYPIRNKGRCHHGFLFTVTGTETYHFNDTSIKAVPDSVLYIPKGEVYTTTLSGNESNVVVVDFEIHGDFPRPFVICFSEQNSIRSCFSKIETEWNRKYSPYLPECKSLCYKIIGLMARQTTLFLSSHKFDKIAAAVEYLHQHYMENTFRLETLSKISGISHRYFETLFRQKYGITPKEYVLSMKIEQAKELLLSEKLLIKDIAIQLGYSDIYHFGKIFAKKTGYTPSEYRNNVISK